MVRYHGELVEDQEVSWIRRGYFGNEEIGRRFGEGVYSRFVRTLTEIGRGLDGFLCQRGAVPQLELHKKINENQGTATNTLPHNATVTGNGVLSLLVFWR